MNRLFCTLFVVANLTVAVNDAAAWGQDGHRITAEVAWGLLTPGAKEKAGALLNGETLWEVSTWADEIRRRPEGRGTAPLHFLNVERGRTALNVMRDAIAPNNVVGAIVYYGALLQSPSISGENRTKALKLLVHFVGDIHQPLHVSHAEDKGGNDIKVKFFGRNYPHQGGRYNLHSVWDSYLLEKAGRPWQEYAQRLAAEITAAERTEWAQSDPVAWARESYAITLERIYGAVNAEDDLGEAYFGENLQLIERRLKQGAVRLAALLNRVFAE